MKNIKYRRQFLISTKECKGLNFWNTKKIGHLNAYVHPDCGLIITRKHNSNLLLIGHFLHPDYPGMSEKQWLETFDRLDSIGEISKKLYPLVGRFVLLIQKENRILLFNDACGLKTIYYSFDQNEFHAASQPLLLKKVASLKKTKLFEEYFKSKYVKTTREHFLPSGSSLYENVHQLVPNHYFDSSLEFQKRFWPDKKLNSKNLPEAERKYANIMKKTMHAANFKFDLAVPITAGQDSRVVLSASKEIAENIYFYTLQYRNMTNKSVDIRIPQKILSTFGYSHEVIDCRKSNDYDEDFKKVYVGNTDMPHWVDWGTIASSMYVNLDANLTAVKGNCAEIGRCFYYPKGYASKSISVESLLKMEYNWQSVNFIRDVLKDWFNGIKSDELNFGYNVLDLFYWEHRLGSWQARSQLEWDIVQEVFTPFNNRELIDIMLSVPAKHRCTQDNTFFRNVIQILWPEVLRFPINPLSTKDIIKKQLKSFIVNLGIYSALRKIIKGY